MFRTVVIDAGHGGHDSGCQGSKSLEKDITLALSLKLGQLIKEKTPQIDVVYTRDKDIFIELHERAKIANKHNASLFISLHCNSGPAQAYGTETFVMGLHKSDANLKVAKRENSAIYLEDDYNKHYGDFNPNSLASIIEATARQSAYLDQSIMFAGKVQEQFEEITNQRNRGVKQAGFYVLYKTTMPAVLVETGFLTNLSEEKLLNSSEGQENIVRAIYNALVEFKGEIDKGSKPLLAKETAQKDISNPVINEEKEVNNIIDKSPSEEKEELNENDHAKGNNAVNKGVVFKVQIAASPTKLNMSEHPYSKIKSPIEEIVAGNLYKYAVGDFSSVKAAQKQQTSLRNIGFKDAFVVAYNNEKRITVKEARNILEQ